MKRIPFITLSIMFVSLTAFAGKEEREYYKTKVAPAIAKAEESVKSACGCPLRITVADSSQATGNDLYVALHVVESISLGAAHYCTDAESKKAVCKMSTLEIGKADAPSFSFSGGKGVTLHDGQSYLGWDQMTRELDK